LQEGWSKRRRDFTQVAVETRWTLNEGSSCNAADLVNRHVTVIAINVTGTGAMD
jgi:hypothetical protein